MRLKMLLIGVGCCCRSLRTSKLNVDSATRNWNNDCSTDHILIKWILHLKSLYISGERIARFGEIGSAVNTEALLWTSWDVTDPSSE